MRLEEYNRTLSVTYEEYCIVLDNLYMVNDSIDLLKPLRNFSELIKITILEIAKNFKVGIDVIIKAFKDRHIFGILKAFGFDFILILKSIRSFTGLISGGLRAVATEIVKTGIIKDIKNGVIILDDLLDKHPILKRLVGLPLAGLLFYVSLHIPCIGDLDFDFDFQEVHDALKGRYKLDDLFLSTESFINAMLLIAGTWTSINFPWLSKDIYTILVGIIYTGFKNSELSNLALLFEPFIDWV